MLLEKKHVSLRSFFFVIEKGSLLTLPWTFIFSLPILHFGIWIDVEGVAFIQSLLGGILALTQISRLTVQNHGVLSTTSLCFVTLSGIATLTLPFHILSMLSWFGHPEGCFGVWTLWTYALALFSLDQQSDAFKNIMMKNLGIVMGALIFLTLLHPKFFGGQGSRFVIYHFTSYLIWPSLGCLILSDLTKNKYTRITFLLLGSLGLILSLAKSAWIGAILAIFILVMARVTDQSQRLKIFLPLIPFASFGVLFFTDLSFSETLTSRSISLHIAIRDMLAHPLAFLTGLGFGEMSDSIIRQTLSIGQKVFQNGVYQPTWEGIGRYDSSSLNQYVDILMGCGALGVMSFLDAHLSPVYKKPMSVIRFIALFTLLVCASLWFIMISTYIPLIMALGMASHTSLVFVTKIKRVLATLLRVFLCLALFWTSYEYLKVGAFFSHDLKNSLVMKFIPQQQSLTPHSILEHKGPAAVHFAFWIRKYYKKGQHNMDSLLEPVLIALYQNPRNISLTLGESLKDAILHFEEKDKFTPFLKEYLSLCPNRPDLFIEGYKS